MFDPTYPLFPIFAFIGFVVALIPLPWHLQAWNSGTCFYMFWASLACLNQFVNSVIWAQNSINSAPIWCEISIRIMLGASVGLPAASLCINRRLYHIASVQAVTISPAEKRRAILIDTLICILFPMIFIALQYVVQGHRFNIYEGIGCYPALYNTLLVYLLSSMWPLIIGLISATYCILSLRSFSQRRLEFGQFLASNKTLTVSRYFRLMALATTEIMLTTPLVVFSIYLNATANDVGPWISWADTHYNYSRVTQVPAILWRNGTRSSVIALELSRWLIPLCALIFFAFFGFAAEAKRNYRLAFWRVMKIFRFNPPNTQASKMLNISSGKRYSHKRQSVILPLSSLPTHSHPNSPPPSLTSFKKTSVLSKTHETLTQISTTSSDEYTKRLSADSMHYDHNNAQSMLSFEKKWTTSTIA